MTSASKRSDCPISMSLDIWGDKWTLLIVRDLMFEGKKTYGQFLSSDEGIATNILAARLKLLKDQGIIRSVSNPANRSSVIYHLTEKGVGLLPLILEIHLWAEEHLPVSDEVRRTLKTVRSNKAGFIQNLADRLTEESRQLDRETASPTTSSGKN